MREDDPRIARLLNKKVSLFLTLGTWATVFFYVAGIVMCLIQNVPPPNVAGQYYHSAGTFLNDLVHFSPEPYFYLGAVSLIITPLGSVVLSIGFFLRRKNYRFAVVSAIVTLILLCSMIVGSLFKVKVG